MEMLGAKILRTPSDVLSSHPDSHISLAKRIQEETPDSIILDQYSNPGNDKANNSPLIVSLVKVIGRVIMMAQQKRSGHKPKETFMLWLQVQVQVEPLLAFPES